MNKQKPIPKELQSRKNAKELRKNLTKGEKHLWYDFLRSYPVRFHRQYVIEQYIVDFFCPKARLIVELDGSQHYEPEAERYDKSRTEALNKYGFLVLRYSNLDIHRRFRNVCEDIDNHVQERLEPTAPSGHLPENCGG